MFHVLATISKKSIHTQIFRKTAFVAAVMAGSAFAQPSEPNTPDIPCGRVPTGAELNEVVTTTPDADGYLNMFDGTTKGWWHSCLTTHSKNNPNGALFRIAKVGNEDAIYSNDRNNDIGGILMTKKKYAHYELVFDFWPDFGNDGGIFNRTDAEGKCFQTVLDYFDAASVGGTWGEGGFTSRDIRPWRYVGNENTISIQAGANGWTGVTARFTPAAYGCAASGCVQADYLRLWDRDGWNQIKIRFYGASTAQEGGTIKMESFFRKLGSNVWVPILVDNTLAQVVEPNFIGIQVHGGNRFKGPNGTWYKNIKLKELKANGDPAVSVASGKAPAAKFAYDLRAVGAALTGSIDKDYTIEISDVQGKRLESFSGRAGSFSHDFKPSTTGWLTLRVKTAGGVESTRILRSQD